MCHLKLTNSRKQTQLEQRTSVRCQYRDSWKRSNFRACRDEDVLGVDDLRAAICFCSSHLIFASNLSKSIDMNNLMFTNSQRLNIFISRITKKNVLCTYFQYKMLLPVPYDNAQPLHSNPGPEAHASFHQCFLYSSESFNQSQRKKPSYPCLQLK